MSAAIYKSLPFNPVDDFQFISVYGYQAFMVAVKKGNPIKSIADLIAAAKAAPGRLTYSSVGIGSTQHLAGELFCAMAGIKMTHVPYRGGNAPMTDLLGGQIDVSFDTITVIEPQVRGGTVQALGVTSGTKWWSLPDVTPIAETVPGYDVRTWLGLAAPKGTSAPVVARLNAAVRAGLSNPQVDARLRKIGMDVVPSSPEEMRTLVASQVANWKKVVGTRRFRRIDGGGADQPGQPYRSGPAGGSCSSTYSPNPWPGRFGGAEPRFNRQRASRSPVDRNRTARHSACRRSTMRPSI